MREETYLLMYPAAWSCKYDPRYCEPHKASIFSSTHVLNPDSKQHAPVRRKSLKLWVAQRAVLHTAPHRTSTHHLRFELHFTTLLIHLRPTSDRIFPFQCTRLVACLYPQNRRSWTRHSCCCGKVVRSLLGFLNPTTT